MEPKIDAITIGAKDMARALTFYEEGFGFPAARSVSKCIPLALSGAATLELCPWDALAEDAGTSPVGSGFRGFTLSYIVEQASDVDDMLVRLERAGGLVSKQPRFAFWGYSAHVTDPSGHLWKIASPKRKPLIARQRAVSRAPDLVPPKELALTIGVVDMKRAKGFYKEGLGNPTKKAYSKFVSFDGGGRPDLAMYTWDALAKDADVPPAGQGFRGFRLSHFADSADGVRRLVARAERAGAKVLKRASGNPQEAQSASFSDLDGYLWKIASQA
jgi:hypothetical protein